MNISINTILCPVDFSISSDHALKYAQAFAHAHDAELLLLHVMELPTYTSMDYPITPETMEELKKTNADRLQQKVDEIQATHEQVRSLLVTGSPFAEIIRTARDEEVDLVVMGTHGRSGLAHMLMGSVAEKVVRKAPCPVLTVKHPEHEFLMP